MERGKAFLPSYHLESAVSSADSRKVTHYVETFIKYFSRLYEIRDYAELREQLNSQRQQTGRVMERIAKEMPIPYQVGTYQGVLDALKIYIQQEIKTENSKKIILSGTPRDVRRQEKILYYLEQHEGVQHGALAEEFEIDKSTLTGVMGKLIAAGLVTFTSPGKFKYYYLTQQGSNYCEENRQGQEEIKDLSYLMALLEEHTQKRTAESKETSDQRKPDEALFAARDLLSYTEASITIKTDDEIYSIEPSTWLAMPGDEYQKGKLLTKTNALKTQAVGKKGVYSVGKAGKRQNIRVFG